MLFINDERISINDIKGTGELKSPAARILREKYKEINEKFFSRGLPVVFKYKPGVIKTNPSNGLKEGKKGIYSQYFDIIKTENGSESIRYAESAVKDANGNIKYMPRGFWFYKKETLYPTDIERALFLYGASSMLRSNKAVIVEDRVQEEKTLALSMKDDANLKFYLYSDYSPLSDDIDKLRNICNAWGIKTPDTESDYGLRNSLFKIILSKKDDKEFGVDAFVKAVKESSPFTDALATINKAVNTPGNLLKVVNFSWVLQNEDSGHSQKILSFSPADENKSRSLLAYSLLQRKHIYDKVMLAAGMKVDIKDEPAEKEAVNDKVFNVPAPTQTRETVEATEQKVEADPEVEKTIKKISTMTYREKATQAKMWKIKVFGLKQDALEAKLVDYAEKHGYKQE